jgi:hypothetical protein
VARAYVRNLRRHSKDALRVRFEHVLFDCLTVLGFTIVEQPWSTDDLEPWRHSCISPQANDVIVYEHKSLPQASDGHAFYMETYFNGIFTIDRKGWGPYQASLPDRADLDDIDSAAATSRVRELSRNLLSDGLSKHWQPSPAAVAIPTEAYLFVPLQLSEDDTIRYHARLGVVEFIDIIAAWARANGVSILFKLHPHDDDALVRAAVDRWVAEGLAHRSAANIHSLIQAARAVYTINSGCGFEALIHGKPVVTFGDCDYANVTFHGRKDNLDEAWQHVLGFTECDAAEAYRWIDFYLERHVIDVRRSDLGSARNRLAGKLNRILHGEI